MAVISSTERSGNAVYPVVVHNQEVQGASTDDQAALMDQVIRIQRMTRTPQEKVARRLLWFWLRIYVRERSKKRTNIRIPIPIPLIGALLPRELDTRRALTMQELMDRAPDPRRAMADFLDSTMAFEFLRVEDDDELVIIGLD